MNEILARALDRTINELFVGEYSPDQECYNICSVNEMLKINREMMFSGSFSGYIPLVIGSKEEVRKTLDEIKEKCGRP